MGITQGRRIILLNFQPSESWDIITVLRHIVLSYPETLIGTGSQCPSVRGYALVMGKGLEADTFSASQNGPPRT